MLKLLSSTANVQIADIKEGFTPLHAAALRGHEHCVRVLVSAGVNISALTSQGKTALQVAEENQHHGVAHVLRNVMQGSVAHGAAGCP